MKNLWKAIFGEPCKEELTGAAALRPRPIKDAAYMRNQQRANSIKFLEDIGVIEIIERAVAEGDSCIQVHMKYLSCSPVSIEKIRRNLRLLGYTANIKEGLILISWKK